MFLPFWWRKFGATIFRFVTRKQHSIFWKRTVSMKTYFRSNVTQSQCCYWLSLITTSLHRSFLTKDSIKRWAECCFQPEIIILLQRIWDLKTEDSSFLIHPHPHPCTHQCRSSGLVGSFYHWWASPFIWDRSVFPSVCFPENCRFTVEVCQLRKGKPEEVRDGREWAGEKVNLIKANSNICI